MNELDRREHRRKDVLIAIMVTPNGDFHSANVMDLSEGGARVALPADWAPTVGTRLRMYLRLDARSEVAIEGRVVRVGVDHLGLQFAPEQETKIGRLLSAVGNSE